MTGPLLTVCTTCNHVWPVAWSPYPAAAIAAITPRACPNCAETEANKLLFASGLADRRHYADWCEREAIRARADVAAEQAA